MRIAVLQMTAGIDPRVNAATLADAVDRAAAAGAAMLFTPEMSGLLDRDRTRAAKSLAREEEDLALMAVRKAARRAKTWVHIGSLAVHRSDGKLVNRGYVIDGDGAIVARYDKLHLFDADLPTGERWRESESYQAGDVAVIVDTPVGVVGLSICYDLRFPDLYRALSNAGATVLSIPAAFTWPTGEAHWSVLLRARAIEAGCFVVAAAQAGVHADGRSTWGRSLVVDPWGEVLLEMGEEEGVGVVDLDPARLAEVRARVPALLHRRPIPPVSRA